MPAPKDPIKNAEWRKKLSIAHSGMVMPPKSDETREKIRAALKGKPKSPEHRKHMSEAMSGENNPHFGKPRSEETKNKIRAANQISCRTQEFRDAISERVKGRNNPQFGKFLTETTKQKLSNSLREYYSDPESRRKIGESHKGIKHSEESKQKLSEMRKGDKNPCWRGGHAYEPYCPKFNREFKERVRAFFNYTCQKCGHVWQKGERKMAVHHVNYNKESCCTSNVTPLFVPTCAGACHTATNHNREYWESYFTAIINEKYNGKCYFTKEEFSALNQ